MNTPAPPRQTNRFRSLLNENKDMVLVFLSAQMNDLFGSTDEALLDFAEQAESNSMQGRFFEALGAIRKARPEIEHGFRQEISNGFEEFGKPEPATSLDDVEPMELALVAQDDVEETVAAENLILRGQSAFSTQLYALEQRLAVLNDGRKVEEPQIPGGPTQLVNAFRTSIQILAIDVKAKIILYALLDKFIMRQLKGLYDEFNSNLKSAGILPNLKPAFFRPEISAVSAAAESAAEEVPEESTPPDSQMAGGEPHVQQDTGQAQSQSLGDELFTSILELMSVRRQTGHAGAAAPGQVAYGGGAMGGMVSGAAQGGYAAGAADPDAANTNFQGGAMPGGSYIPNVGGAPPPGGAEAGARSASPGGGTGHQRLLSAIEHVGPRSTSDRGGVLSDLDALPQIVVDPNFINNLKQTIAREREQIFEQIEDDDLQSIDADTIDLIGMLFEYMLNDPLLPNLAKALLSHLHTPYLKLSLTERQLLVDSEHPARLLLDMLVEAGGQWVYEDDPKRGIFPQMRTVVDRILQESHSNNELFEELQDYFKTVMDEQRRRSDAIEHRAQESVKGREKLHVAKKRATDEMDKRIQQSPMPTAVTRFLSQAWTDRLVFILLRHQEGEQSEDWLRSLKVADDLMWLFDAGSAKRADAIRQTAQGVRQEIESALDSLGGYHQHYLDQLYEFLDNPASVSSWRQEQGETQASDLLVPDTDSLLDPPTTPIPEEAAASPRPRRQPKPKDAGSGKATLFGHSRDESSELTERERDMVEKLQHLKFGTWFEFRDRPEGSRRLKLSWLSPLTSTCMFVDRAGAQAEVKSLAEVAKLLLSGRAKLIPRPKHQFVERAMSAIKGALQRSMESTG